VNGRQKMPVTIVCRLGPWTWLWPASSVLVASAVKRARSGHRSRSHSRRRRGRRYRRADQDREAPSRRCRRSPTAPMDLASELPRECRRTTVESLAAIGAGTPGPVERQSGTVRSGTVLRHWTGIQPRAESAERWVDSTERWERCASCRHRPSGRERFLGDGFIAAPMGRRARSDTCRFARTGACWCRAILDDRIGVLGAVAVALRTAQAAR
jgi:hypothetical protein